jgi:hypothetical protein
MSLDSSGASAITDHPFVPSGAWYSLCGLVVFRPDERVNFRPCGLAEAAHAATTLSHQPKEDA